MKQRIYCFAVPFGIATLVALLRMPALSQAVIDWDESVYLLMARSLLQGHAPYTAVWDHKPPGLYALFAASLAVLGQPVLAMRLLGSAAVSLTATLLWLMGRRVLHSNAAGLIAALSYVAASTRNGGLATNAEILFAPCTVAALLLLTEPIAQGRFPATHRWLGAGLLFGAAMQIKTAAGFELSAAGALLVLSNSHGRARRAAGWLFSGAALPTLLMMLGFALAGQWQPYAYANFTANARYVAALPGLNAATITTALKQQARSVPTLWAAVPVAALSLPARADRSGSRPLAAWLLIWLVSTLPAVVATGRLFPHYFLQCLPPLSLLLGWSAVYWARLSLRSPARRGLPGVALLALLVLLPLARPLRQAIVTLRDLRTSPGRVDALTYTADYLRNHLAAGDTLFVADGQPVLYALTEVAAPTPYVLPAWLYDPDLAALLPIDAPQELARILRGAPRYIVTRDEAFPSTPYFTALTAALTQDYQLERVIQGQRLYRRVDS